MLAEGLSRTIAGEPDLRAGDIVGSASEAVRAARTHEPHVVLMDYRLREGDGVTATRQIKSERHEIQPVMLTGFADPSVLIAAMDAGCSGFLPKDPALHQLLSPPPRPHAQLLLAPPLHLPALPPLPVPG